MKRLDLWLGKNLFQPPIILLCQLTGMTQYAVHRYLWWAIVAYAIWGIEPDDNLALKTILIILGVSQTISAGLFPDRPADGSPWMRYLFIPVLAIELVASAVLGKFPNFTPVAVLFAEYALTIKTIPPRNAKEAAGDTRRVEA